MEIKEFAGKVCDAVSKELGGGYCVELREVVKNNGVVFHGVLIQLRGLKQGVAPTIYLESFLEAYEAGTSFAAVIRKLLAVYREDTPGEEVDMEFFHSFEKVRDRICYRLVGRKANEEALAHMPYIEFLDLAVCFYYAYQGESLGEGVIRICDSHVRMWDVSTSDLLRLAQCNTPRIFPAECNTLESIVGQAVDGDLRRDASGEEAVYVLSNKKRLYGASCILYPRILEEMASGRGRGFYILPSSIHEVILLTDMEAGRGDALRKMIREVNASHVAPEDVLSDNLYYYDFFAKSVKIVL